MEARQAQKGNSPHKPLNILIASAGSRPESMPVDEMPGYHFPENQIGAVVSTHSRGSSPLAGEDRIHSIQQLSVMWEKNQCVREKLLRSPRRRCHLNQRHCGAAVLRAEPRAQPPLGTFASLPMAFIVAIMTTIVIAGSSVTLAE